MPQPRKLHDEFFKKAKEEGYAARSAYKLLEVNEKYHLIQPNDRVLDLGCAPGSWLQVLDRELLSARGRAVGMDLQRLEVAFEGEDEGEGRAARRPPRITALVGDVFATDAATLLAPNGGELFDVVISDMAPNTSGHGDDFLSARLCERVLDLCPRVLRPGGNVLMKILEGEPTPEVIRRTKTLFIQAGTTKPKASRDVSREIFIWGKGFEPANQAARPRATGARAMPQPRAGWSSAGTGADPDNTARAAPAQPAGPSLPPAPRKRR